MKPAGTVHTSDWKDGFLFVGNHLALDFLNTRPIQNDEPMELLPDFSALLRWFQAAELLSTRDAASLQQEWGKSARARRTVEALRELREKLRKEILAWEGGSVVHNSTVDELNRLMADYPMRTRLKTKGSGTELWFKPQPTGRVVCSACAQRREIVRRRGSQPRPQVRTMRTALSRHQQEGHKTLVQHAAMREPSQGRSVRGSSTSAVSQMTTLFRPF